MNSYVISLFLAIFSGIIGYITGIALSFREQKLKIYEDSLQIIRKIIYQTEISDQPDLNKALIYMWLYGSSKVAKQFDKVVSIRIKLERGDIQKELQELIVFMRNDIQLLTWHRNIRPDDIKHLSIRLIDEPPKESTVCKQPGNAENRVCS